MKDQKSFIFHEAFRSLRLQFADRNQTAAVAEFIVTGHHGGFFQSTDEDRRTASNLNAVKQLPLRNKQSPTAKESEKQYEGYTFLHIGIDKTDPPLACECIRHGALIEHPTAKGQTPLLLALERIWDLHSVLKNHELKGSLPKKIQGYKAQIENAQSRLRYITIVLIEQHADVNATVEWQSQLVSSLHLACAIGDWDLITLLLEHGAQSKPTPSCVDAAAFLPAPTAKRRLTALRETARKATRPPRISLSDCHVQSLPYPEDFTCSCGSAKAYGKCCKTRQIRLTEAWDTTSIRTSLLIPLPSPPSYASPETHAMMEQVRRNGDMEKVMQMIPEVILNEDIRGVWTELIELGLKENLADPAFKFAYFAAGFLAAPRGRSSSKHWCRQKQKEWNAAVDKYIASGVDSRPRSDIEAAAKIGISHGAMLLACEAEGCDKVEGRDTEKMLRCARCKMTFYCSATCQKLDWPTHKRVCGTAAQTERPLPSQVKLLNFVISPYIAKRFV
ncbi:hypothetical protein C8R46DRAFT_1080233 [Mycena filopes]|nr:hypothetical protein C8R46DRAFT_1080233 [Mycena filopes]